MEKKKSLRQVMSVRVMTQLSNPPETTALQKLLILIGAGIFLALVAVTAGLPINFVSHQDSESPLAVPAGVINEGDSAWMIVAAFFAFVAIPSATYFFGNFFGVKSTNMLLHASILVSGLITTLWIVTTFALIYGPKSAGEEYKILAYPRSYYMFAHVGAFPDSALAPTIPLSIFAIFELAFALMTALIITAAVIDRVSIYGLLAFLTIWHIIVYSPVAFITWNPNGYLITNEVIDFSGGLVVNMLAGITIFVLHVYLNWKGAPKNENATPKNQDNLLINALALWCLYFGLTAGKAHDASSVAAQSVVNTIACVMTSIFFNYLLDLIFEINTQNLDIVHGILLGLVSATPCSGFVDVGGAMVITVLTVIATRWIARLIFKDGVDGKVYSSITIFGLAGSIAFLLTPMLSYKFINPAGRNGLTYGYQTSIRHNLAALLAMWFVATPCIFVLTFIVDLFVPLNKAEQAKGDYAPTPLGPARVGSGFFGPGDVYRENSTVSGTNETATINA